MYENCLFLKILYFLFKGSLNITEYRCLMIGRVHCIVLVHNRTISHIIGVNRSLLISYLKEGHEHENSGGWNNKKNNDVTSKPSAVTNKPTCLWVYYMIKTLLNLVESLINLVESLINQVESLINLSVYGFIVWWKLSWT